MGIPAVPWHGVASSTLAQSKAICAFSSAITTQCDPQGCWFSLQRGPHCTRLSPSSGAEQQQCLVPQGSQLQRAWLGMAGTMGWAHQDLGGMGLERFDKVTLSLG